MQHLLGIAGHMAMSVVTEQDDTSCDHPGMISLDLEGFQNGTVY
jgi:hypothetical protein